MKVLDPEFFGRYGPRSIVLARFVPIVRTCTPIVAGVSGMHYRTFVLYNLIGGTLWGTGVTILGYFLGQIADEFVRWLALPYSCTSCTGCAELRTATPCR